MAALGKSCCGGAKNKAAHQQQDAPIRPADLETMLDGPAILDIKETIIDTRVQMAYDAENTAYLAARESERDPLDSKKTFYYYRFGTGTSTPTQTRLGFTAPVKTYQKHHDDILKKLKDKRAANGIVEDDDYFRDDDFPPDMDNALCMTEIPKNDPREGLKQIVKTIINADAQQVFGWKRARDVVPDAQFVVGNPGYVNQGCIGDCYLIGAINAVMRRTHFRRRVIPDKQSFATEEYTGIFRFRFWQAGHWIEVFVDDKLPVLTVPDGSNWLLFSGPAPENKNEMWGPLLHKAMAKVAGGYLNLVSGHGGESMEYLTGAAIEDIVLVPLVMWSEDEVWKMLQTAVTTPDCAVMARTNGLPAVAGVAQAPPGPPETDALKVLMNIPLFGHAYSVIRARTVPLGGQNIRYVCVRDPNGTRLRWSVVPPVWPLLATSQTDRVIVNFLDTTKSGEMWMPFDKYLQCFFGMSMAHMHPERFGPTPSKAPASVEWLAHLTFGSWLPTVTAVGGPLLKDGTLNLDFWRSPQYAFELKIKSPLILSLSSLTPERRTVECGFVVFQFPSTSNLPVTPRAILRLDDKAALHTFPADGVLMHATTMAEWRPQVYHNRDLAVGKYLVLVCVAPGTSSDFMLRAYYQHPN